MEKDLEKIKNEIYRCPNSNRFQMKFCKDDTKTINELYTPTKKESNTSDEYARKHQLMLSMFDNPFRLCNNNCYIYLREITSMTHRLVYDSICVFNKENNVKSFSYRTCEISSDDLYELNKIEKAKIISKEEYFDVLNKINKANKIYNDLGEQYKDILLKRNMYDRTERFVYFRDDEVYFTDYTKNLTLKEYKSLINEINDETRKKEIQYVNEKKKQYIGKYIFIMAYGRKTFLKVKDVEVFGEYLHFRTDLNVSFLLNNTILEREEKYFVGDVIRMVDESEMNEILKIFE